MEPVIVQEKPSELTISDADSDVLFDEERKPLAMWEYEQLKALALKSARDFLTLYEAIPEKGKSCCSARATFYGQVPRTALEMYEHTKNVNDYYFGEIGVAADHEGTILECRERGFALLEKSLIFLRTLSVRAAMGRNGPCESCCGVLSGTTGSTQRPCIGWLSEHLRIRFPMCSTSCELNNDLTGTGICLSRFFFVDTQNRLW